MTHLPAALDTVARAIAYPTGVAIFLNQLDELFIDGSYLLRRLHARRTRAVSLEALRAAPPKRIAILVPAWKEAEVIEQMLAHNLATLDYDRARYAIFVGTYPNDPDTQRGVDAAAARHPSIHKVVVPHDGPTSKADCLNWVYQGVILEEQRAGRRFDILLMHDSEDVIHPQSLRLYALLIPGAEFVQTPVFSLELPVAQVVSSTYVDEFAEHHLKEMRVRDGFGGLIPSAGVGSAFDRDAFEAIAAAHAQRPFNTASLTEDYEIGLKFRLAGRRVRFACHTIERRGADGRVREEYIATREFFPARLGASVRQRSRWILGITMQTWQQLGWKGPLAVRYCLWRDRKALFTNALLVLGYLLVLFVFARTAHARLTGASWDVTRLIPPRTFLYHLLFVNLFAFVGRALVKGHFVRQLYGWRQAIASAPRLLLSNCISVLATARALRQYLHHRWTGEPLRWLKTTHEFPSFHVLAGGAGGAEPERAAPAGVPVPMVTRPLLAPTPIRGTAVMRAVPQDPPRDRRSQP